MKILNNIGCALNSIELKKKWDANWWRSYWKFAYKYDVGKKLWKATNLIEELFNS
jgi:hypothetical protein